jgi:hypothetical protein
LPTCPTTLRTDEANQRSFFGEASLSSQQIFLAPEMLAPQRGDLVGRDSGAMRELVTPKGRVLKATVVLDTYWRFASARQEIFLRRLTGEDPPWTTDPILATYRFTNPYRASDRVTQYLIRHVLYEGSQAPEEVFFRAFLFRMFNRIETWEQLSSRLGNLTWEYFDPRLYRLALDSIKSSGLKLYSSAYIIPSPRLGSPRKHVNHLRLLQAMMLDQIPSEIQSAESLSDVFAILRSYPSMGDFLSFQFTIDLNYSEMLDFSENDFVVAGPGAIGGIGKCFSDLGSASPEEVIETVAELADEEFERLDLTFRTLWGRRLQLIDFQNLFCEVDKYARVAHPNHPGGSSRRRIKRKYSPNMEPLPQWYPPKWEIDVPSRYLAAGR